MKQKYYLMHIWGCVEPSIEGDPYNSYDDLLAAARQFVADGNLDEHDIICYLRQEEDGSLSAGSFVGDELYEE